VKCWYATDLYSLQASLLTYYFAIHCSNNKEVELKAKVLLYSTVSNTPPQCVGVHITHIIIIVIDGECRFYDTFISLSQFAADVLLFV